MLPRTDVELFGDARETGEHLVELLLPLAELAATRVVDAEESEDRVDDLQGGTRVSVAPVKRRKRRNDKELEGSVGRELGGEVDDELQLCDARPSSQRRDRDGRAEDRVRCSLLAALPTMMLSITAFESSPKRSAMARTRSGRNVPSVSM